ncbi:hypothetical protein [Roseicyclus marinus]|uniref:hypothetical protein n=1 Tax=Roseicyclus marinus TaxID=2161673 RepID=UPI002410AED1|nr:hypothetical protein [Roseicyclus marinus]
MQSGKLRLRHHWSKRGEIVGLQTASGEARQLLELLELLGLKRGGSWSDAATAVFWRVAPEEVPPPQECMFLGQVEHAVAAMPKGIEVEIRSILAKHRDPFLQAHLVDWIFFEHWRWSEGWLVDDHQGRAIGVFHDHLAQRMSAAVVSRFSKA